MRKNLLITIIAILVIWLIILSVILFENNSKTNTTSEINEYNVTGFSTDFTKVVEANKSSIVSLNQNEVYSTGFIYKQVDNHVYIISSYHGVSESEDVSIEFNSGVIATGKVIGQDLFADVAIIDCEFNYDVKTLHIGDATLLNDGEFILSIGTNSSKEYDFSTAFGMISYGYREIENSVSFEEEDYDYYLGVIQLSGDFTNGYSGAPVLNMNGDVVGMITMEDEGKTFAVTINEIEKIAEKIINNEEYTRISFGLYGRFVSSLENYEISNLNIGLEVTNGYYVINLKVPSLANNIGILRGDIITKINDVDINNFDDVLDVIYSNANEFNVTLIRNNETITLQGNLYD